MNTLIVCALLCAAIGQEQPAADAAQEKLLLDRARQQMRARWAAAKAFVRIDNQRREVARREQPILSYFEPARDGGRVGALWIWGTTGRPVAMHVQATTPGERVWGYELVALTQGVSAVMYDGWKWSPDTALQMTGFSDAPPAADNEVARLIQMKALARRFSIRERYQGQTIPLRMLPRPIYRYQDQEDGLMDGGLFNFAHGTGPETIVVIECRQEQAAREWSYGFLPLGGAAMSAKLNGTVVWTKKQSNASRAQTMYSVWLEKSPE